MGHYDTCRDDRCSCCGGGLHADGLCPFSPTDREIINQKKGKTKRPSSNYKADEMQIIDLTKDSGEGFLELLPVVAQEDAAGLERAYVSYGPSWKQRGGVGAFMMLARKWDRLENQLKRLVPGEASQSGLGAMPYDIFGHVIADQRAEGVIDDIRDLRRYLMLVEAEMRARGFDATHRDNRAA
jgi:hypothetical protein